MNPTSEGVRVETREDRQGWFLDEPDYRGAHGAATFSVDGRYRYDLWRRIGQSSQGQVAFICLNPSTATERVDDATVTRLFWRSRHDGYEGLHVVNLFGLRATDPRVLRGAADPIGSDNDRILIDVCMSAAMVVCAWGAHGSLSGRGVDVLELLHSHDIEPRAFGLTRNGQPLHPLYLPMAMKPRRLSELLEEKDESNNN